MKRKYYFELWSKRIRYKFDINRNITFIEGDSGTGKSILIDLLMEIDQCGDHDWSFYDKMSEKFKSMVIKFRTLFSGM